MKISWVLALSLFLTSLSLQAEDIRDSRNSIRGKVVNQKAYNERNRLLGVYRDGKTYTSTNRLFGYGDLLSALVVLDATNRGVWK
jgi:hypothetical protein